MSMLSNTTASRLIATLAVPADRDPLGLINPASIRAGCKCEHCRWQRGLITGIEEPAPTGPGVPLGWLSRTPDAPLASNDMSLFTPFGSSQRALECADRRDYAGWAVAVEQSFSAAYPLVPNPWSR